MRTIGLSPKLYPAIIAILTGIALLLLGLDVEGRTAILTGLAGLGLGWALPPGDVVPSEVGLANDDALTVDPETGQPKS